MSLLKMTEVDLNNKRVLIREDFNVPLNDAGQITSDARLIAALPTLQLALQAKAKIILLSHLGRPIEGTVDEKLSLASVAKRLGELLNHPVRFEKNWIDGVTVSSGEIVLCENVRFQRGEKNNDPILAKKIARLCDIFVMDAFATAHRAQASTVGVSSYAPIACAGPLLLKELIALNKALACPAHPLVGIVGGSKVSTKLAVLEHLMQKVDQLIVGGGIANTFLLAAGYAVGRSLCEPDLLAEAKRLLALAKQHQVLLQLPQDVVVANEFSAAAKLRIISVTDVQPNDMILDVGPKTTAAYAILLKEAGTIVWNGPVGVFEFSAFSEGTRALALAIAESNAFSLAGGGDTLSAIEQFHVAENISYISTGGGAFLEFMEGKTLPAVAILQTRTS